MSRKQNFNDFNLNTNEFESDDRFTVTISSDSDFDDDPVKPKKSASLKSISCSSLEKISSSDEDICATETYRWHCISVRNFLSCQWTTGLRYELKEQWFKHYEIDFYIKSNINDIKFKYPDPSFNAKLMILDTILENVEPFQFIPYLYNDLTEFHSFFIFDCEDAINKLYSLNETCISKKIPDFSVKLEINRKIAKLKLENCSKTRNLNFTSVIKSTLKKRYDKINKTLDLTDFENDKCIQKLFYMPLWYVGNQTTIVSKIKNIINTHNIEKLNLSSNSINDFEGFNIAVTFSNLQSLNISRNKISHIKGLVPFRGLTIKEFNLQFNPICHNYINKNEYISSIKLIFPTVKILVNDFIKDSHNIANIFPCKYQNYSVNSEYTQIIDKFMAIYFSLFDSGDRSAMINLYSKNAIFSLSCEKTELTFYKKSRNLIDLNGSNIYIGPRSIIGCLCWIPSTEHIPLTFCVDVFHSSEELLIFNISGIFVLTSNFHNIKCFSFVRTFVVVREEQEYKIANDMFNIKSAQLCELPSHLHPDLKNTIDIDLTPCESLSPNEKLEMVDIFVQLTKFAPRMAEDCLVKNKWNFKDATNYALNILKSI